MRIVFDGRTIRPERTGVGHYTERLLRGLMALDQDNEYLVIFNDDKLWWTWEIPGNFRARRLDADYESHPWGDFWERYTLPAMLRRERAQFFHGPAFLIPPVTCCCPTAVTIHDLTTFKCPSDYSWRFRLYMRWVIRRSCAAAGAIIAPSHATAHDLRDLLDVPDWKIQVVPEAPDECFEPAEAVDRESLAEVHPVLRDPYILTVGTIEPRKRIDFLVRAFEKARATASLPHNLVIVGKVGWKAKASLRAIVNSDAAGAIHHLDYVSTDNLAAIYQAADLFVSASRYEGFGLPPLEAMACGVPVVTTPGGALGEVVGTAGMVIEDATAEALGAAVAAVLTDEQLRASFARKSLERAANFSWEETARKTLEVYKRTGLSRTRRRPAGGSRTAPRPQNDGTR